MTNLSKAVLARKTISEKLGLLDVSDCSYTIAELVERFGADAKLCFDYDYEYDYGCCSCSGGTRITTCAVTRERVETDDEYDARITAEEQRLAASAGRRAKAAERAKARAAAAAERKEAEERKLYEELRNKFG